MYDHIIIGGGLAGLCCAFRLGKAGYRVALIEKGEYPQHRVCGEYLSAEVKPFLEKEGLWPKDLDIPYINKMHIDNTDGAILNSTLDLGGYGVSRYTLDYTIYQACLNYDIEIMTSETVTGIHDTSITLKSGKTINADFIIGAFGKRSNLDRSLNRSWRDQKSPYLGVKYHRKGIIKRDTVSLYNFPGGYCGVNAIENNVFNCCYLVHQEKLRESGSISAMEKATLYLNANLKSIFMNSTSEWDEPISIGAISFLTKGAQEQNIPMIGDAAGMIAPLCGNGMAMAIQSAHLLSELIITSDNCLSTSEVCLHYSRAWNKKYARQLAIGRTIQNIMTHRRYAPWAYRFLSYTPGLLNKVVRSTHGTILS